MENLMNKDVSVQRGASKQGAGLVGYIIGMTIAILIGMALLPSITSFISDAALSGTNASIASLLVTALLIVILVAVLGPVINL